jgi:ABC-type Mn2+/Zn2+ transport system ATPase subunit
MKRTSLPINNPHSYHDLPAHLDVSDVSVGYNGQPVLEKISFSIPSGAYVAVVGPNGAGKSTLFKMLVGLLPVRSGHVTIHGQGLGRHKDCVAYIPQREEVDWRFPVTVSDVVLMGRYGRLGWLRRPSKEDHAVVRRALQQLGIENLKDQSIGELSGGQQQRVFLARAIAQEPHILLLDEPFTGIDAVTQEVTLALLEELHTRGVTILVSTHDLNLAAQRFERVLLLNRKIVAFGPASQVFTPEIVRQVFSGQMLYLESGALVIDQCCPPDEENHR